MGSLTGNIFTGLAVFFIVWWMVLFAVLPWGAHPHDDPTPGLAESAPENPRLPLKLAVTTVLAGVITLVLAWIAKAGGLLPSIGGL